MRYLRRYDDYLKRLAGKGHPLRNIGTVQIVVLPYFFAVLFVSGLFEALGWTGPLGFALRLVISVSLIVGLFWSGFRYVHHSSLRRRQ